MVTKQALAVAFAVLSGASSWASPILTPPAGQQLRVTQFASGLNYPTSMTILPDGSLLAGTTLPSGEVGFGSYYLGTGVLMRFTDSTNAGVADGPGVVVAAGLPGAITSVRQAGDLIAVSTAGDRTYAGLGTADITFLKPGATPNDPYTNLGSVHIVFSSFDSAINVAIDTRPTPGSPGSYDLFFGIGSGSDTGLPVGNVTVTGLLNASLPVGSLYKTTVNTTGGTPAFSQPSRIASGIRNTGGLLVNQSTGDLYFGDNNSETLGSTDELNLLTAAQIASGTTTSFGFPNSFTDYATGTFVGGTGVPALAAFRQQQGQESFGIAELAFAPSAFPAGLNSGILVGFDGDFNLAGPGNITNPVLFYNSTTGTYSLFIAGGQVGIGHLIGLASTPNKLYLADLTAVNGFVGGNGAIYEISLASVPEPSYAWPLATGLLALTASRFRRRDLLS